MYIILANCNRGHGETHVQEKRCCVYQHIADQCIVERFILGRLIATDCYVEPLCRLGGPFVKSALEEVVAGCVRPGVSDSPTIDTEALTTLHHSVNIAPTLPSCMSEQFYYVKRCCTSVR